MNLTNKQEDFLKKHFATWQQPGGNVISGIADFSVVPLSEWNGLFSKDEQSLFEYITCVDGSEVGIAIGKDLSEYLKHRWNL